MTTRAPRGREQDGVEPDDVWPAVRAVWVAGLTPLVMLYARARAGQARDAGDGSRDGDGGLAAPGVIVQRMLGGARTTVYTRPPGRPTADEVWLEGASGRIGPGTVPVGEYKVKARFRGEAAISAGRVSVSEGQAVALACSADFQLCKVR